WSAFPGRHSLVVSWNTRFMHVSGELSARSLGGAGVRKPSRPHFDGKLSCYHCREPLSREVQSAGRATRFCPHVFSFPKEAEGWSRARTALAPTLLSGGRRPYLISTSAPASLSFSAAASASALETFSL